jgi:hypothetical protein
VDKNFIKYFCPDSGFITKPPSSYNTTDYELQPDLLTRWECLRERFSTDWRWYDEKYRNMDYRFDKYGFRNHHDPDTLEDGYIMLAGQSVAEGTGNLYEDTIACHLEKITGRKVYVVATNAIDCVAIHHNIMTALHTIKARPNHIVYLPTLPYSAMLTVRSPKQQVINILSFYGGIKYDIADKFDVDIDWLTQTIDLHRLVFDTGYQWHLYDQCARQLDYLPYDNTILSMTDDGEGDFWTKPETILYTEARPGHERFFETHSDNSYRLNMGSIPHEKDMNTIFSMQLMTPEQILEITDMNWINRRSRDLIHPSPEENRRMAEAIAVNVEKQ